MIVGRAKEINLLEKKYSSGKSEFVALYGRRRVGKTYLVRSFFNRKFTFQFTGSADSSLQDQLQNFNIAVAEQFPRLRTDKATSWIEAFQQLKQIIQKSRQRKKVIFIDELPWLDTPNSGFIKALEHFWNSWASARKDILLIVCGSAASWMINKLINNKGGLHNRVTQRIKIEPFSIGECEAFLKYKKIKLDHYQIIQLYMVLGGIPFYWDGLEKGLSASQNIEKLCFSQNGLLVHEFPNLFKSLFSKAERHEAIVSALARKTKGLTRDEIISYTKLTNGGSFTRLLEELEESGFIRKYMPFGRKMRNSLYQLSDFYTLFYLKFREYNRPGNEKNWLKMIDGPKYRTWSGYAFEQVCLAHVSQIKKALGISGIESQTSTWRSEEAENGAQIDLVIDRRDGIINLFEIKFSINPFAIDKKYDAILRNKVGAFKAGTNTRKSVFISLLTTFGVKKNAYSGNIHNDLRMGILFEEEAD